MSEHATESHEIDVEGATAALEQRLQPSREAIEVSRDRESGQFTRTEDDSATPAAGDEAGATDDSATPAGTDDQPTQDEDAPSFTHIPDEALSPELLAVKRSMQADYTKKTQETAEYRKLAEEFGDPAEIRQALELQKQLSDPQNWPALHAELTQYLRAQGLSPREADAAAAGALGQAIPDDVFDEGDDYESDLPPAVQARLDQMEQRQNELIQVMYQREAQAAEEARFAELARDLTAQENKIRDQYREQWGEKADEYIETVYDLAGDSGDLSVGLTRLETLLGYDAARYLTGKEEARRAAGGPIDGAGVIAQEEQEAPHTLEEGHERAMEYIRAQQAAEAGL